MSDFKTKAEILAGSGFIQYLELLRSGSKTADLGVNRLLEQFSDSLDSLLDSVLQARNLKLWEGGTISVDNPVTTLSWTDDIAVGMWTATQGTNGIYGEIAANPGGLAVSAGQVLYVQLDRTAASPSSLTLQQDTFANYLALLSTVGNTNRLDYCMIALIGAEQIYFCNDKILKRGESLTKFSTDSQYGQQTELTTVHDNEKENLKYIMSGGGDLHWDHVSKQLTFTQDIWIESPHVAGQNIIRTTQSPVTIDPYHFAWVTMVRNPTVGETPSVTTGATSPNLDNTFVFAQHNGNDTRLYLWDGTAISSGETVRLGGVRAGVQWFHKAYGNGTQITTFGPSNTYRTGGGELMVYRNGIKAKASLAVWKGLYPLGTLDTFAGGLAADDDYVEEDNNGLPLPDTGYRVIWLRDTDSPDLDEQGPPVMYRPEATNDPPMEWPQTDDAIEAFVGVQAQAPTINVPDGIYGFENVWTQSSDTIRTAGGTVAYAGAQYRNDGSASLELVLDGSGSPPGLVSGDPVIVAGTWCYVYLTRDAVTGLADIKISPTPPDDAAGGAGKHPSHSDHFFLTSVWLVDLNNFRPFYKRGSWVQFGGNSGTQLASHFPAPNAPTWESVNLSSKLPPTYTGGFRLALLATAAGGVSTGDLIFFEWRQTSSSYSGGKIARGIKPGNYPTVDFEIDVVSPGGLFDVRMSAASFTAVTDARLLGYAEGRFTSGDTLGA